MSVSRSLIAATSIGCAACLAQADGGVPIASVTRATGTCTLLVSPAAPTVGEVEFTLLGLHVEQARLLLEESGEAPVEMPFARAASLPGVVVRTTLEAAGACRFEVRVPGETEPLLAGELPVQPAPPAWTARWPWLFAWVPFAALLALRAVAERARTMSYTRGPTR